MSDELKKEKETLKARITELERENERLEADLIHDHLTGLKTRKFFEEELGIYLETIKKSRLSRRREWFGFRVLSVILFDADYFKRLNDTHGHLVGDEALQKIASVVGGSLREGDTAARWGGEEIIALLPGASERDAVKKAEEIRREVEFIRLEDVSDLKLSVSAGVAQSESGISMDELVKRTDRALYHAKKRGRNRVSAYSELGR